MIERKYTVRNVSEYDIKPDKTLDVWAEDVTDGYHTFQELYRHRFHLYIALLKVLDRYNNPINGHMVCWKSRLHHDGTMFDDMFIAGITISSFTGPSRTLTYHLPNEYWDKLPLITWDHAPEYDGHTSDDVLKYLLEL